MNTNETDRPFYPIDTAPKDGTWVELRARTPLSGGRRIAQWNGTTWVCKNGDRYFIHDDCWRPIAPTPAPATSETPRMDELANQLCAEAPPIGDLPAWKDYMVELVKKITFAGVKLERELTAATRRAEEAERERDEARACVDDILGDMPNPHAARREAGITCHHLPRLTIGSENGYICCECWAIETEKKLAEAQTDLEKISECFEDDAPHKHEQTGVSLVDDVRDHFKSFFGYLRQLDAYRKKDAQLEAELSTLRSTLRQVQAERDEAQEQTQQCVQNISKARAVMLNYGTIDPLLSLSEQTEKICAALAGAEKWQPIESAPRDGTEVLLWSPKYEICHAAWNQFAQGNRGGWLISDDTGDGYGAIEPNDATHWHPLPAPPAIGGEKS